MILKAIVPLSTAIGLSLFASSAHAMTTYRGYSNLPEPQPTSEGQLLYQEMGCVMCHGIHGDGDGFMAEGLHPKPRNFTSFEQMSRLPDQQMANSIRSGVPNTGMPGFAGLSEQQVADLIAYVRGFMANFYLTLNLCVNEQNTLSLAKMEMPHDYTLTVDRPDFLAVKKGKSDVTVKPQFDFLMKKTKGFTERQTYRIHLTMVSGKTEADRKVAFVAVRVHNCFK
jgi:cytochrome c2